MMTFVNKQFLLKMLLRKGLLLVFVIMLYTDLHAQITLGISNKPIREILRKIEETSEYRFFFNENLQGVNNVTSLKCENFSIEKTLSLLFSDLDIDYEFKSRRYIVLFERKKNTVTTRQISATIVDENQEPIIGANIMISDTKTGTITDVNGKFTLLAEPGAELVITHIGHQKQIVQALGINGKIIVLDDDVGLLNDVMVVGYGIQRKVNLTAAVATINARELENRHSASVSQQIQGLTAGVTVLKQVGSPGNDIPIINIRGINTINPAENSPFCLIDGAPAYIETVNPADIESISILKDAAATSIYGSSAASGVILINLKKGVPYKSHVTLDSYYGIQFPTAMPETVDALDFMRMHNLQQKNNGLFPLFSNEYISQYGHSMGKSDLYPNTNWLDEVVSSNYIHNQDLAISGGNSKLVYRFSLGNLSHKGLIPNTGYNRKSVRINSTYIFNEILTLNVSLSNLFTDNIQPSYTISNIFKNIEFTSPLSNARLQNGKYGIGVQYGDGTNANALALAEVGGQDLNSGKNGGVDLGFVLTPIKGLDVSFIYSYRSNTHNRTIFKGQYDWYDDKGVLGGKSPFANSLKNSFVYSYANQYRAIASYSMKFQRHFFSLLTGMDNFDTHYGSVTAERSNFLSNDYQQLDDGDISTAKNSGRQNVNATLSAIGRVNYTFDDKYILEINARNDRSSLFAPAYRNAFFPSISAGWRVNEEEFMLGFIKLTNLKVRASWGQTGRAVKVSDAYSYMMPIDIVDQQVVLGEVAQNAAAATQWADEKFSWEKTEMYNIGLDFGFFKNRLSGELDLFDKQLTDGVSIKPATLVSGLLGGYTNFIGMRNKGWELTLRWMNQVGKLKYSVGLNMADIKNEITDLGGLSPIISGGGVAIRVGHEVNSYYIYKSDGLLTPEDIANPNVPKISTRVVAGNVKLVDLSGSDGVPDGIIDGKDRYFTGTRFPRYQFSAPFTLDWNGFDAYLFLQGVAKSTGLINRRTTFVNSEVTQVNFLSWEKDTWDAEINPKGKIPAFGGDNGGLSDYYLKSNAYIRLKTVTLGYTLPSHFTNKLKMDKVRFYVTGENVLTFSNFYQGFDPEIPVNSNVFNYPNPSTFIVGLNIEFK